MNAHISGVIGSGYTREIYIELPNDSVVWQFRNTVAPTHCGIDEGTVAILIADVPSTYGDYKINVALPFDEVENVVYVRVAGDGIWHVEDGKPVAFEYNHVAEVQTGTQFRLLIPLGFEGDSLNFYSLYLSVFSLKDIRMTLNPTELPFRR